MAGIIKVDRVQSDSNLAFNIAGANVAFMDASALRLVGSGITANGTTIVSGGKVVTAAQPAGAVLQVVQTVKTSVFSTSSQAPTYVDLTGLTVSITPTSTTSKILVSYSFYSTTSYNGGTGVIATHSKLQRNGSDILIGDLRNVEQRTSCSTGHSFANYTACHSASFLDSPATTSALTYKVVVSMENSSYTAYFGGSAITSNQTYSSSTPLIITAMEIAG